MKHRMSSRPVISILAIAALQAVFACAADPEPARTADPPEDIAVAALPATNAEEGQHPITDEERREVTSDPGFAEAMAVLSDEGNVIDLGKGMTSVDDLNPKTIEIQFQPTYRDGVASREYAEVVYQRIDGGKPRFYFVALGADPDDSDRGLSPAPASSGCGPWSNWITSSTFCGYRWLCGRRNDREGIFKDQYRSRYCTSPGAYEFRTRLKFDHCGC